MPRREGGSVMVNDRVVGAIMMLISIVAILFYVYSLFINPEAKILDTTLYDITVRMTIMFAALGFFGILAWVGFTLLTTPPPKPIEEIEREIEKELKKIEENR